MFIPRFFSLIVVCIVLITTPRILCVDYYVALDGEDTNPGTEEEPWQTIQKAADTMIAGDTVYITEGTYVERIVPQNSGNPDHFITYRNYPDHNVIINSPNEWVNDVCVFIQDVDLHYLHFMGLTFEGASYTNFYAWEGSSGSISHFILEDIRSESSFIGVGFFQGVTDSVIRNCEINENQYGIFLYESNQNILIENNHVSEGVVLRPDISDRGHNIFVDGGNTGNENYDISLLNNRSHHSLVQGILIWESDNVLVKGNHCHHNGATGIQIESYNNLEYMCTNIIVEDNVCNYNSQSYPSETGIWIDDSNYVIVQNNTLDHNEVGLKITGSNQVIARRNLI